MVIDTSAMIAILRSEPEVAAIHSAIAATEIRLVSAASVVEAGIVALARWGEDGSQAFDSLLQIVAPEVVPVSEEHARLARGAFARYGKGRHPAALNFGDCFSYALAQATGQPLLFKGQDFSCTDIGRVL